MPAKWSYPRETTSRLADLVRDVQNPPTSLRERLADLVRDVLAQHVPREVRLDRVLYRPIRQRTSLLAANGASAFLAGWLHTEDTLSWKEVPAKWSSYVPP